MLLDESMGEDGTAFILYCLSVVLSVGGDELWGQFTTSLSHCASVDEVYDQMEKTPAVIWLPLRTAREAVRAVFVKALEAQMLEALESIEALKQIPHVDEVTDDKQYNEMDDKSKDDTSEPGVSVDGSKNDEQVPANHEGMRRSSAVFSNTKPSPMGHTDATHINFFTWMRLMAQLYNQERQQRAAAIRLMFEAASIGALTPMMSGAPEVDSVYQHVEFPQFQSVLRTLVPTIELTEIAMIYNQCHVEGNKFVTADGFIKVADKRHLFSRSLRFAPLPLLETPPKIEKSVTGSNDPLSTTEEEFWQARESYQGPHEVELLRVEQRLRARLGAIVHKKLTLILPELNDMMKQVPERWRLLLEDLIANVQSALRDSFAKGRLKVTRMDSDSSESSRHRPGANIDGIQPYIHYYRLLSLALTVRGMSSSPIMPGELFRATRYDILPSSNVDIQRGIRLLSSLENALLVTTTPDARYFKIGKSLRALVGRRILKWYKNHASKDGVYIPLSVRIEMRPGYLRGINGVRKRRCVEEPWYAQSIIAQTYFFKLQHDKRAIWAGEGSVSLAKAVLASHMLRWGNADVADRFMHDFFHCAYLYEQALPRLRLFLIFLGVRMDPIRIKTDTYLLLNNEKAVTLYLDLVAAIHMERYNDSHKTENSTALFPSSGVNSLFASDIWIEKKELLRRATSRWVKGLKGCMPENMFTKCLELAAPGNSEVDVDDYLWLVMMQWAQLMVPLLRTTREKLGLLRRQQEAYEQERGTSPAISAKKIGHSTPLHRIGEIMSSVYAKSNSDVINPGNISVDMIFGSRVISEVSGKGVELHDALEKWMLWDLTDVVTDPEVESIPPRLRLKIESALHPSISVGLVMIGWTALQNLVEEQINEVADNKEQDKRLQLMRRLKLRLDEIFQHLPEPPETFDTSIYKFFPTFTLEQEKEIYTAIQSVFSIFAEYLNRTMNPDNKFPNDLWKRGLRVPIEGSSIYGIDLSK